MYILDSSISMNNWFCQHWIHIHNKVIKSRKIITSGFRRNLLLEVRTKNSGDFYFGSDKIPKLEEGPKIVSFLKSTTIKRIGTWHWSLDGIIGIMVMLWAGRPNNSGSFPGKANSFVSSPNRPFNTKIENQWMCTSSHSYVFLVCRDNIIFTSHDQNYGADWEQGLWRCNTPRVICIYECVCVCVCAINE